MSYKYVVKDNDTAKRRLIEASSPANAVAFVAKDNFTVTRVTDDIADMIGLPLEKVTADAKPADPEPAADPAPPAAKGKAPVEAE